MQQRTVPPADQARYRIGWDALVQAVVNASARAWVFHSTDDLSCFVEFIEFRHGEEVALFDRIASVEHALEAISPGSRRGTWQEWSKSNEG